MIILAAAISLVQPHQHHGSMQHQSHAAPSLTVPAERVTGLKAGQGLGYAKAAEMQGFPGPKHVLELRSEMDLSDEQVVTFEAMFADMLAGAVPLGELMVERGAALDALFAEGTPDAEAVETASLDLAHVEARLRAHHLKFHLLAAQALSEEQTAIYYSIRHGGE